jgi:hypothetical protein
VGGAGIGGGRDAGIGDETCRRLGFLLGWDVFIPHCKKIGWLRFAARKIRRLMCKDRCEAPMGASYYTFRYNKTETVSNSYYYVRPGYSGTFFCLRNVFRRFSAFKVCVALFHQMLVKFYSVSVGFSRLIKTQGTKCNCPRAVVDAGNN